MNLSPPEKVFKTPAQRLEHGQAIEQTRSVLRRIRSGVSRFDFWLTMAIRRGFVRPAKEALGKVELPPRFPGKPLSKYLEEVRG